MPARAALIDIISYSLQVKERFVLVKSCQVLSSLIVIYSNNYFIIDKGFII
jgi:hypothetical protein